MQSFGAGSVFLVQPSEGERQISLVPSHGDGNSTANIRPVRRISRVRKQRITYRSMGPNARPKTVLTLEISLRAFSQALLVSLRTISNQKAFQRWANEEEHETVFQKMDSQQMAATTAWVKLFLRETSKRCHDIIARLDEPGMIVKGSFATDFCLPENQSSPATRSVRRPRDCTPTHVRTFGLRAT